MGTFLKILLVFFIFYFLFSWIRKIFMPSSKNPKQQPNVRIFKKGEIEKSSMDMHDAETLDFEEIESPKKLNV